MQNRILRRSRRTSHRVITASVLFSMLTPFVAVAVSVVVCCALLVIQAVKGPTVAGCFFPALGVVSGLFYLATTRCGK